MGVNFADAEQIIGVDGEPLEVVDNAIKVRPHSGFQKAVKEGWAFNWGNLDFNYVAADTVIGLENTDPNKTLYIEKIVVSGDTASQIVIFGASGITVAGTTAITAISLNRAYQRLPLYTCTTKETGQNEAGTSWLSRYFGLRILADTPAVFDIHGSIALPYDHMIGIDVTTEGGAVNACIWGWYE